MHCALGMTLCLSILQIKAMYPLIQKDVCVRMTKYLVEKNGEAIEGRDVRLIFLCIFLFYLYLKRESKERSK